MAGLLVAGGWILAQIMRPARAKVNRPLADTAVTGQGQ
jgi:hypothetical protein